MGQCLPCVIIVNLLECCLLVKNLYRNGELKITLQNSLYYFIFLLCLIMSYVVLITLAFF